MWFLSGQMICILALVRSLRCHVNWYYHSQSLCASYVLQIIQLLFVICKWFSPKVVNLKTCINPDSPPTSSWPAIIELTMSFNIFFPWGFQVKSKYPAAFACRKGRPNESSGLVHQRGIVCLWSCSDGMDLCSQYPSLNCMVKTHVVHRYIAGRPSVALNNNITCSHLEM